MDSSLLRSTINTVNSVIGVSVLAMPFCFNQCGIVLGIIVLLFVAYVTYLSSCQLLKLANFHKKRSYEFLAMHVFGAPGKLVVELSMIGLMMGTFVAFFVIIGDLGPEIARELFELQITPKFRAFFLIFLGVFVVVPLSLQKNIDNLSSLSAVSLLFYFFLLLHIIFLAFSRSVSVDPKRSGTKIVAWNPGGIFKCMPIMSMSFGCQTQLFVVYESLADPTIKSMKYVIRATLMATATVYVGVGLSGYMSFAGPTPLPGDILILYENTLVVNFLKLGFVLSVAISFPLLIFPLRASIYSLIFLRKGPTTDISGDSTVLMPDHRFRGITLAIVMTTLTCGILVPNVEFVLALTGSVTGSFIFFILPSTMYIKTFGIYSPKPSSLSQSHRRVHAHAHLVLVIGFCVLIVGSLMALEDQKERTEALKISMAKHEEELRLAEKLAKEKEKPVDVAKPNLLADPAKGVKGVKPKDIPGEVPDTGGVAERKEPANPDKPAVNIFINSSKSKAENQSSQDVKKPPGKVSSTSSPHRVVKRNASNPSVKLPKPSDSNSRNTVVENRTVSAAVIKKKN